VKGRPVLLLLLAVLAATYLLLLAPVLSVFDFEAGQGEILPSGFISPVTFNVPLAGQELEEARSETESSVPFYLVYDDRVWPELRGALGQRFDALSADSAFANGLLRELSAVYDKGVLDMDLVVGGFSGDNAVVRRNGEDSEATSLGNLNIHRLSEVITAFGQLLANGRISGTGATELTAMLRANVVPDSARRAENVQAALEAMNLVDTVIVAGDTLVPPGGIVTGRTLRFLEALRSAGNSNLASRQLRYNLGRLALLAGVLLLGSLYVRDSMKDSRSSMNRLLLLATIWLLSSLATGLVWLVTRELYRGSFATFVTFGAALTSIFFHRRDSAVFSVLFSASAAAGQPHPFTSMLVGSASGCLAGYMAWDLRRRVSIPLSAALASAAGLAALLICKVLDIGLSDTPLWVSSLETLVAPVVCLGLAFSLLPTFEKVFGVTTVLAIGEARNRNHTLLRELSQWAMGTWQHSQEVADLAAEAARAIDADAELAEAGGLFHDVGKLMEPRYFIENLPHVAGGNPHDTLPPQESTRKVIAHVAEGVRLARKFNVPPPIIDIISQHHGTTCVKSFYEKARQSSPDPDSVRQSDYRYPGPLPASREAAVVMLADAVESATKNLGQADREKLEEIVSRVIEDKDADGQLDHCAITRGNLISIQKAFLQVLQGRFHERIQDYPYGPDPQRRNGG
jgi:putative nucleotidyltransferase with HDIG domain